MSEAESLAGSGGGGGGGSGGGGVLLAFLWHQCVQRRLQGDDQLSWSAWDCPGQTRTAGPLMCQEPLDLNFEDLGCGLRGGLYHYKDEQGGQDQNVTNWNDRVFYNSSHRATSNAMLQSALSGQRL